MQLGVHRRQFVDLVPGALLDDHLSVGLVCRQQALDFVCIITLLLMYPSGLLCSSSGGVPGNRASSRNTLALDPEPQDEPDEYYSCPKDAKYDPDAYACLRALG